MPDASTKRQIIVCSDGTNNNLTGGITDTNVVKLIRLLDPDAGNQVVYYDPGVGNPRALPGATVWDKIIRIRERVAGLAMGRGVYENVAEAYQFLMDTYRRDDELYFFGFSRGAFTARSVAGMVNAFGILRPHMDSMVPTLLHLYFSHRRSGNTAFARIAADIKHAFAIPESVTADIHFTGVWDTVASVGMWPFAAKMTARPDIAGKRFVHVRQALALDEHRVPFKPRMYLAENGTQPGTSQTVDQRWFHGAHCDVGGGYANDDCGISDAALAWLVGEAQDKGLRLCRRQVREARPECVAEALTRLTDMKQAPRPIVHSETYGMCLWAVAGLTVRDPSRVDIDGEPDQRIAAEEHSSVSAAMRFPEHTVWRRARRKGGLGLAILLGALALLAMASLLLGRWPWDCSLEQMRDALGSFAGWQLCWLLESGTPYPSPSTQHPGWAVLLDFPFVLAYAYVLAWFVAPAFAALAGLSRVDGKVRWHLPILGRALTVMVVADVTENILTWVVLALEHSIVPMAGMAAAIGMSAAAAAKWLGLAGTLVLIACGAVAWLGAKSSATRPGTA